MIDHCNLAAPVKEVADLNGFDQGPLCDFMRKSTVHEINLGPEFYAYFDSKRNVNLSIAA